MAIRPTPLLCLLTAFAAAFSAACELATQVASVDILLAVDVARRMFGASGAPNVQGHLDPLAPLSLPVIGVVTLIAQLSPYAVPLLFAVTSAFGALGAHRVAQQLGLSLATSLLAAGIYLVVACLAPATVVWDVLFFPWIVVAALRGHVLRAAVILAIWTSLSADAVAGAVLAAIVWSAGGAATSIPRRFGMAAFFVAIALVTSWGVIGSARLMVPLYLELKKLSLHGELRELGLLTPDFQLHPGMLAALLLGFLVAGYSRRELARQVGSAWVVSFVLALWWERWWFLYALFFSVGCGMAAQSILADTTAARQKRALGRYAASGGFIIAVMLGVIQYPVELGGKLG
ncbi:MAG: hypothetical protein KDD44_02985, partial [Bdellovibrionales bacterium]|nr:hypothetical protein [Bdellovibrionales bacterium]